MGDASHLETLLDGLPLPQRQALLLTYAHDLGAGQAGALLGRSPEAIRQLRHRGLSALARAGERPPD
jgi:DNA-directed RNA polymerase specialized sigma24 family protein